MRPVACGRLIAIHDTTLGPAFGGCRIYAYASVHQAMADVLRLSRGMTYKSAICELPYGGGKSVIIADPRRDKTPALLHAMGRLVEDLSGRYIVADDVGTTLADLVVMREVTHHTAATTAAAQQPLSATAFGVFSALGAAAEVCPAATTWRGCGSRSRGWAMSGSRYAAIWQQRERHWSSVTSTWNRCQQAATLTARPSLNLRPFTLRISTCSRRRHLAGC
jgi:leucine dehydrogenase